MMKIFKVPKANDLTITSVDVLKKVLEDGYDIIDGDIEFLDMEGMDLSSLSKFTYSVVGSLVGCPKGVNGNFQVYDNPKLQSLVGGPVKVEGVYWSINNSLKDLEGAPKLIKGNFLANNNNIESLNGCPEEIWGNIGLRLNNLTSLIGLPDDLGDSNVSLMGNPLTELMELKNNLYVLGGFVYQGNSIPEVKILKALALNDKISTYDKPTDSTIYANAYNGFLKKMTCIGKIEDFNDSSFLKINGKIFKKSLLK